MRKRIIFHFALLEILIVIVILSILSGILLPALTKSRNRAYQVGCITKCKQIAVGMTMYATDFDGHFPVEEGIGDPNNYWTQKFKFYISDLKPVTEPIDFLSCTGIPDEYKVNDNAESNYMSNFYINRRDPVSPKSFKNDQVVSPSRTMLFICGSTASDESVSEDERALKSRTGTEDQVNDRTLQFPHLELFQGAATAFVDNRVVTRKGDSIPKDSDNVFWNPRR